jgi:C-terminal processing protease CtpA/Prc
VGAKREISPDGSPFEGVGIKPDVAVAPPLTTFATGGMERSKLRAAP